MLQRVRAMPGGIRLFLVYGFVILFFVGAALPTVINLAVDAPITFPGVVITVLLAYTIFTMTLVIQRKQAGRGLALGLATLVLPLIPLLFVSRLVVESVFVAAFALLLFRGLLRPDVRDYLNEL